MACLEPDHKEPVSKLAPDIMEEISDIGSAVVILLSWNEANQKLVRQLYEAGIYIKIVIVSAPCKITGKPENTICLNPEEILSGDVTSL